MTLAQEKVEALIHGIYEAATAPDRWPDALKGVGEAINSSSASALWFDGTRNSLLRGDGWNVDPEAIDLYGRYYVTICPRLRRSRLFHAGDCYDDRVLRERPSPTDREYFAFMDSHGHSLARTLLAERDAGMRMGLTFYGPNYDDPGGEALRLLSALAPHVRRASHLTLRLMEATERAEFGDDLFEMSSAMLLLGSGGAVRRINGRGDPGGRGRPAPRCGASLRGHARGRRAAPAGDRGGARSDDRARQPA